MIIAVINQKGGVGKTTTTVNLGAALAQMGYRVLLIDLDVQGSLMSFANAMSHPSLAALSGLSIQTSNDENLESVLQTASTDFVIIDCPPTLGQAHITALLQSDLALAPMPPRFLDAHGLSQLMGTIDAAHEHGNSTLQLRIVLTMRNARVSIHRELESAVRDSLGSLVLNTVIPLAVVFDKASLAHISALQLEPRSTGAQAYCALAQEILEVKNGG